MGGYDVTSRYDPSTMGRIADAEIDAEIDPESELFDHADNAANSGSLGLGLKMTHVRSRGPSISIDKVMLKKALLGLAVVGAWAGVIVGIVYVAKSGPSAPSAPAAGGDVGGKEDVQGIQQFVPPPDDLAMKCAPLTVSKKEGWDECKSFCAGAECCFLPEGHWFSCKESNKEDCSAYEYGCLTLDHVEGLRNSSASDEDKNSDGVSSGQTVTVLKAPSDIAEKCSPDSLATPDGHAACQKICDLAKCCDQGDSLCIVSNPDECVAYEEPCAILRGTPASHPDSISSQAKAKCNTQALMTPEGVKACEDFCEPAMCCFESAGQNSGFRSVTSCLNDENAGWCSQYGACQGLLHVPAGGKDGTVGFDDSSAAKAAVNEACSNDFMKCKNICDPAACCFHTEDNFCPDVGLAELECDHYEACEILFVTTVLSDDVGGAEQIALAEAPPNLKDLCSSQESDDLADCEAMCRTAHCCSEKAEDCVVVNLDACDDYEEPCLKLWKGMAEEVSVPSAPEDLADLCSELGSQGCRDACEAAKCCDLPIEECKVRDPDQCDSYEGHCQPHWDAFQLAIPPEKLKEICAKDAVSAECKGTCRAAACCSEAFDCDTSISDPTLCADYRDAGCVEAWDAIAVDLQTNNSR